MCFISFDYQELINRAFKMNRFTSTLIFLILSQFAWSSDFSATAASGDWNQGATWGNPGVNTAGVGYPSASDNATIPVGKTVTIPAGLSASVASLSMGDGITSTMSYINLTSTSSLTVNGTLDIYEAQINLNGGTLTVTGTINGTVGGVGPTASINMTTAGSILNVGGGITTDYYNIIDNANGTSGTINYDNTSLEVYNSFNDVGIFFGPVEFKYYNLVVSSASTSFLINDPDFPLTVNGNLITRNTSQLNLGDIPLFLGGNLVDQNVSQKGMVINSGHLTLLNGSTNQTISSTYSGGAYSYQEGAWFEKLRVYNTSGGVTLSSKMHVKDSLNLKSGKITSTSSNRVILESTCNSSIGSSTSYVDGYIEGRGWGMITRTIYFPLGSGNTWRPIELTHTHSFNNWGASYTASLTEEDANNLEYPMADGVDFTGLSKVRYYEITRTATATGAAASSTHLTGAVIKIYYNTTHGADDGVTDPVNLGIAKTNATDEWTNISSGQEGTAAEVGSITSNTFTSFSKFSLSNGSGGGNPLPVNLLRFNALPKGDNTVDLSWTTLSEQNNDRFEVQRSVDGKVFETIITVAGNGNISERLDYTTIDKSPLNGHSYYRLKQVDHDGKSSYFSPVPVHLDLSNMFTIFPNPATDMNEVKVRLDVNEISEVLVIVQDITGRENYSKVLLQNSGNDIAIDINDKLPDGIYFITATSKQGIFRQKLIIQK